jgi:transcriptional regulator of heat shock response
MQLFIHTESLFQQIRDFLCQLTEEQYNQRLPVLYGSSIGQHLRHVIECFEELEKGYEAGTVNYDNRQRNLLLETDKDLAAESMDQILSSIDKKDKLLQLAAIYSMDENHRTIVGTNYYREWMHNIEHTVHHMALIKTGAQSLAGIQLPASFGTAVSTQRAKTVCAQ